MILITGATGLVGSQICKHFIDLDVSFLALKRESSKTTLLPESNIKWIEGDILDAYRFREILEEKNIDVVIHCAAIVSYHKQDEELMYNVNVRGTKNVVDVCIESGVRQLIHISSIAALGRKVGRNTIHENDHWVESPFNSAYARTKYLAELEVWRGHNEGVDACVVNPSVVIAPGDGQRSSSKLLQYVWDEKKFYTKGKINYVDVRDVARVVGFIYSKQVNNERFILNAGNIEYHSIFKQIAKNFNRKSPNIRAGSMLLKLVYILDQIKYFITRIRPVVTKEMLKSAKSDFLYINDKSRTYFSMEYTPLDKTLKWACGSFKQLKKG